MLTSIAIAIGVSGCFVQAPPAAVPEVAPLVFQLNGRWTVQSTTFPMWHEPDKRCPIFEYEPIESHGRANDRVLFLDGDEPDEIRGIDEQDPQNLLHITWQGSGLLFFLSSDWYVRAADDDWLIIYFSETMFTPEGVDVLARGPSLDEEMWAAVDTAVNTDPWLARFRNQLKRLDRSACPESHRE